MRILLLVIMFSFSLPLIGGSVDSLLKVVQHVKHDTSKVIGYEQIAVTLRNHYNDSALSYNNKAVEIASGIKDSTWLAEAYREYALTAQAGGKYELALEYYRRSSRVHKNLKNEYGVSESFNDIGIAYYYSGKYDSARVFFEKAGTIKIELGDSIGAGQSFNNTGIMHDIAGRPLQATKLYLRALSIYENLRDTNMMIGTLSNIGIIYIGQKNYHEAIKIYERQKELAKKIRAEKLYGVALTSEGTAYDYLEKYDMARNRFLEALDIFLKLNDKPLIAQCYNNLSINYELTNEDEKALAYALKAIKVKEEIKSYGKIAVSQIAAAKIYNKKGNFKEAEKLFTEALNNAQNAGYVEHEMKAHKGLALTYSNLKNFEQAYYHQNNFISLSDSITNKENRELINELEKKYQSERKEKEIELLNKTNALKSAELDKANEASKRKSIQLYGSLALAVILLVLFVQVYKSNKERKKSNELLQKKNEEITYQKDIVDEKNKEIMDSITYAKRIQSAILPPKKLVKTYLDNSFILYKPKDIVAGDFYWMESCAFQASDSGDPADFQASDSRDPINQSAANNQVNNIDNVIFYAAADCTGHGVPGAMVSVMCSNVLTQAVKELGIQRPGKILDKAVDLLEERFEKSEEDVKDGMDVSLCRLDLATKQLEWAGANNPLWLVRKKLAGVDLTLKWNKNGQAQELTEAKTLEMNDYVLIEIVANKQPIGKYEHRIPFDNHEIQLMQGDGIYIFSDGYPDQFGGDKGKKFKSKTFKKLILEHFHEDMETQRTIIDDAFEVWKGDLEQVDDVCIIGVRI